MLELMETRWKKKPGANFVNVNVFFFLVIVNVNVDFVAFTSLGWYGTGVIVRDEFEHFVAAQVQRIEGYIAPSMGELVAAKMGILARELGKNRIELEVDAKNVWKSISESEVDKSYGGNILSDIFVYGSSFHSFV